ncbi:MAG: sugar ABC transporter permease [Chloroflexi bacterium]|nr:sugar ABC transporter permease [Chloroflexota bacterium]
MDQSKPVHPVSLPQMQAGRAKLSRVALVEDLWGYLFISPWIIGFLIFTLGPMAVSLYYGLTKYEFPLPPRWVGAQNFIDAFTKDTLFRVALGNTAYYVIFSVPLGLAISLFLALLLDRKIAGRALWRTIYYVPSIVPVVVTAFLFGYLFQPEYGLINGMLRSIGIQGPRWFNSSDWVKPTLILLALWAAGGATMIIFLAGLQNIPTELYEAAMVDGAGRWSRFWNITIPMLSPTIFFNLVTGIIGAFKVFTSAYVATAGGPNYASYFFVMHLFNSGFRDLNMGYASALAWILFVIIMVFTLIQLKFARRWVYYESDTALF